MKSKIDITNARVMTVQEAENARMQKTLSPILWNLRNFMKQIIEDSTGADANLYSMRIECADLYVKFMVCNANTKQITGKAYPLESFLNLCLLPDKIEFEMNRMVKQLIIFSDEKTSEKVRWI